MIVNWDYFVGFLDGEGSIILKPPRVRLYVSNTNKEVLEKVRKFLKCGTIYYIKKHNNPK